MKTGKNLLSLFLTLIMVFSIHAEKIREHRVQDGESLYGISRRYNIPLKELCKINNISDKYILKKGAVLKLPVSTETKKYTVEKGDNLFRIGMKYNITVTRLCELNGFSESESLSPGRIIKVPVEVEEVKPATQIKNQKKPIHNTAPQSGSPENLHTTHIMKKGETLYQLSKQYNTSVKNIQKANKMTDSTILKPGMSLIIPAKNSSSRNYINYDLPLDGRVVPYVKSHYRGVLLFSKNNSTSVLAVDDGVVSHIDMRSGYGLIVFIKHSNGLVSTYSGFSEIYVKKDMAVKKGEIIGKPGSVSRQTDPAILFSLQDGSRSLSFDMNALKFFK